MLRDIRRLFFRGVDEGAAQRVVKGAEEKTIEKLVQTSVDWLDENQTSRVEKRRKYRVVRREYLVTKFFRAIWVMVRSFQWPWF